LKWGNLNGLPLQLNLVTPKPAKITGLPQWKIRVRKEELKGLFKEKPYQEGGPNKRFGTSKRPLKEGPKRRIG